MKRLVNIWQKARHAGVAWTARALWKRGLNRLWGHPALRGYIDRDARIDGAELLHLIDFGPRAPQDLEALFTHTPAGRHFLESADETASLAKEQFPEAVKITVEAADAVCRHDFHFLGQDVSFGDKIDWCWMPDGNGTWPDKHVDDFEKREYYGEDRPGDIKYPWELARHQYFMTLAKAYRYTGDEKYAVELTDQMLDWIDRNPVRHGIHWISEMEFGIRIISWSNAFWLVKDSEHFVAHGLEPFLRHLYEHARYLNRTLTTHWLVANNHLLGEAAGLFAFSVLFPQFRDSQRWQQRSLKVFTSALKQQIFEDGVNREQATGYHRFVLDFVWVVVRLGELNDVSIPSVVYDRLRSMLEYEAAIVPPDGIVPQVGDCDDGRGIYLSESVPFFDFRGWLAVGAVQFGREDLARAACGGNEEALWLLGAKDWKAFETIEPADAMMESRCFDQGGHAVLRTGDDETASFVFVRCGEYGLGTDGSSVHSHADVLSPIIYWRGHPLTVDCGTYAYYCPTSERDALRSVTAHNSMAPRGVEPATMFPIFNWGNVPKSRIIEWRNDCDLTTFSGETNAEGRFVHRRTLTLSHEPHMLEIVDELDVADDFSDRPVDFRLHLAPGVSARIVSADRVSFAFEEGFTVEMGCEGFDSAEVLSVHYSPSYGVRTKIQCLQLTVAQPRARTRITIRSAAD